MARLEQDLLDAVARIGTLDKQLQKDTWRCHRAIQELNATTADGAPLDRDEAAFWLRTFLRVFFAQVEGFCFAMRASTVALASRGHVSLSAGEVLVLGEKRYRSQQGKIKEIHAYNDTLENLHLAFRYFPSCFGVKYTLLKSDSRWDAFRRCLELRNRQTHPKSPEDLEPTPASFQDCADGLKWFTEQVTGCFEQILRRFDEVAEPSA